MATLFQLPKAVPISAGEGYAGAKCHFYQAGTTTNITTYTTAALSVAHANPVVADANGVFAPIFINEGANSTYKIRLVTSADVLIYETDNLTTAPLAPDGTVSAPGMAFQNDQNTGIYRSGSDLIAISVGGAQIAYGSNASGVGRWGFGSGFSSPFEIEVGNSSARSSSNPYLYIAKTSATGFNIYGYGDATWQGALTLAFSSLGIVGAIFETSTISPAQLTADTNDWNPTGLTTCAIIRASTDASRNLTGLQNFASGAKILLCNIGAQNLVLVHESASSAASNRFLCPGSAGFTLNQNDSVYLWYDATSTRWRVIAPTA